METHCRIRNTKPKLQILPKPSNIEDIRALMHKKVDRLCDNYTDYYATNKNLAAFAIVIIGPDGSYGTSTHVEENAAFGRNLLPAIVSEVLRCVNIEDTATEVFNGSLR